MAVPVLSRGITWTIILSPSDLVRKEGEARVSWCGGGRTIPYPPLGFQCQNALQEMVLRTPNTCKAL